MWLLHCKQGFPSCDRGTVPSTGDTPKLLLNIVQAAHLLLPHVLFTKLRWHALKWRWPRILLLGTKQGLELLPMPTAHSRHLLAVQSLFSQSLLLYSQPTLTYLWEKSSENTKITETVLEAVKTEKPDFLQMCISWLTVLCWEILLALQVLFLRRYLFLNILTTTHRVKHLTADAYWWH